MKPSPLRNILAILRQQTRWQRQDEACTPRPLPWQLVASDLLCGFALSLAALLLRNFFRLNILAPLLSAAGICLLRGWLTNWRQAAVPTRLASLLLDSPLGSRKLEEYRPTITGILQLLRPFLFFLLFCHLTPFWTMAVLLAGGQAARETLAASPAEQLRTRMLCGGALFLVSLCTAASLFTTAALLVLFWLLADKAACPWFRQEPDLAAFCGEILALTAILLCNLATN